MVIRQDIFILNVPHKNHIVEIKLADGSSLHFFKIVCSTNLAVSLKFAKSKDSAIYNIVGISIDFTSERRLEFRSAHPGDETS